MKSLPIPSREHARDQLIRALQGSQRGAPESYAVTTDELDALIDIYDAYDESGGSPSDELLGSDLDAALRKAIRESYPLTRQRRRLAEIRASLMQGVERCPLCSINAPRVLDHYLPQYRFEPLAIYTRNLIPVCMECNEHKSKSASPDATKRVLHAYFDLLPPERILRANATIKEKGLVVSFGPDDRVKLPDGLRERLTNQMDRLHLDERYAKEINLVLISHATSFKYLFDAGGRDGVRMFLEDHSKAEFKLLHVNHWRPLLLQALSEHDNFCDGGFLEVLALPPRT